MDVGGAGNKQLFLAASGVWGVLPAGQRVQTRLVQGLCQQIGVRVFGGVTCNMPVTDTVLSYSFKASVSSAHHSMISAVQTALAVAGVVPICKRGLAEICNIVVEEQKSQMQMRVRLSVVASMCQCLFKQTTKQQLADSIRP